MKKTILATVLAGCSCAVMAQTDSLNNTMNANSMNTANNLSTSTSYNAFGTFTAVPPDYVSSYVIRDYPMAMDVRWQQNGDWWHGYYMLNDVPTHVYYNTAGQTFTVALPVKQSLLPETVISKATQLYGPTVYDITTIKGTHGQDVYHIRIIENGVVSSQYMDESGNKVIDIYRMDDTAMDMNSKGTNTMDAGTLNSVDANAAEIKIKTETKDGKETKTKIKNGKIVKQKTDD